MNLAVGATLAGKYRVLRQLGEGGMGGVYLVEERATGQRWALKEALADETVSAEDREWASEHFDAEVALLRRLTSSGTAALAGIPTFHDDFAERGRRYLVMEYLPGDTLEARIDHAKAPLSERDVVRWMVDVCYAMEVLHHEKPPIILRDLKPGNVILTPSGPARIIDFGIARTYKVGQATNTENLGTLAYASPEHHGQGQTDVRSDIYSLGATMYHALTGHEPQPLEMPGAGALIHWNRALTPQTEAIVVRAMRLDPAQRYQSAAEMRAALEERVTALSPRARLSSSRAAQGVVAPRPAPTAPVVAAKPAAQVSVAAAGAICPRCGHKNRVGARFCARDGAPLTPAAARRVAGNVQAAPATNVIATPGATHALRATEAFAQGRYHQAIQQGQVALTHGHTSADLLLTLARSYEHVGRPLEAAETFDRAASARPDVATLLAAARAWRASGRLDEAQIDLSKARQLAPEDTEASYLLGLVNLDLGHLAQAEGDLRDTLRLKPDSVAALIAVSRVEEARGQSNEAMETLRQALALDPASGEAQWRYGRALLERGQFPDAARALEKATQLGVESADVYVALGMAYHATGRRQKARDAVRAALRLAPHHPEAQKLLRSL